MKILLLSLIITFGSKMCSKPLPPDNPVATTMVKFYTQQSEAQQVDVRVWVEGREIGRLVFYDRGTPPCEGANYPYVKLDAGRYYIEYKSVTFPIKDHGFYIDVQRLREDECQMVLVN